MKVVISDCSWNAYDVEKANLPADWEVVCAQIDHTDELSADYEEHLGFALDEPIYMDVYLELNHLPQRCPFALKPPTQTTYPRGVPLR